LEPIPSEPAISPKGYLSDEAKSRFTLLAGILGFLFFLVQAAVPFLLMMAMQWMMFGVEPGRTSSPQVWNAVFWEGAIWYVEESLPRRMAPRQEATLQRVDPGDPTSHPTTKASLFMENPRLLAGQDRLWVISSEDVRYFMGNKPTDINVGTRLGQISYPFMMEGRPAVLEERPGGMALTIFRERRWERGPLIRFGPENDVFSLVSEVRVVPCGAGLQLFMPFGEMLHYREGLPAESGADWSSWEPVGSAAAGWSALCVAGEPVVFLPSQDTFNDALEEYRSVGGAWKRTRMIPLQSWGADLGVAPSGDDARHFVLAGLSGGSLAIMKLENGEVVEEGSYFRSETETRVGKVLKMVALACLGYLAAPIALALILSGMMSRWRTSGFGTAHGVVLLAPIWRRALSEVVDTLILGAPLLAGNIAIFWRVLKAGRTLSRPTTGMGLTLIFLGMAWVVVGLLVFSFTEGRWGTTPGKWIFGIRVIGSDLRPCGFLRGLVRNLLRVVDGFFNFMVGLLVTALSENWQRVGDMAARTIVIQARGIDPMGLHGGVPSPAPSGEAAVAPGPDSTGMWA
jgi:uncharacterized RDD family membrane protein YckC